MATFVNLTDSGEFLGFYHDEIQQIPPNARPLTDEQYQTWLAAGGDHYHWPEGDEAPTVRPVPESEKLDKAVAFKSNELKGKCASAIISGCPSSALGEVFIYPTTPIDTQNLGNSALAALSAKIDNTEGWTTPFWTFKPSDLSWAYRQHTADQIIQAAQDVKAYIVGLQSHYAELLSQVNEATTESQVLAIQW
jgi:hypothetical protein